MLTANSTRSAAGAFTDHPPTCDDQCTATARVLVQYGRHRNDGPLQLAFCGHHYRAHGAILSLLGWMVAADLRGELVSIEDRRRQGAP